MTDFQPQIGRPVPVDPRAGEAATDELDLQQGLTELAGMVAGSLDIEAVLVEVAGFAAHAIPGAEGAGVALLAGPSGGAQGQRWSATAGFVQEVDRIQYEVVGEGPCLSAAETGRVVVSGSLGSDERWPRFGGHVARLGVHSALSLPLVVNGTVIGAINSYSRQRDAFTEHAVRMAEKFAGPAGVAMHSAQLLVAARTRADQLQAAFASRAVIDQAIGILRSRSGGSAEEAFDRLRELSQAENLRVPLIAQRLVDEAVRRARARNTSRG